MELTLDIASLNNKFGIGALLSFTQLLSGTKLIAIDTPLAAATISLEGGQVVAWHPKSQSEPVLWVSKLAQFAPGKAIRAGVPICWPWFGAHPKSSQLPGHGFARVVPWSVESTRVDAEGVIDVKLKLADAEVPEKLRPAGWPQSVSLAARYRIGETLEVSLSTENNSEHEIRFTEGLHTYFQVGDAESVQVLGLDKCEFVDLLDGNQRRQQKGPITFEGEVGKIFVSCDKATIIEDRKLGRNIHVVGAGSTSIAVWNPGLTTASKMPDLGSEGWKTMVCVETANALENSIQLHPGCSHTTTAVYSVVALT
ncbi:D-hexose-6-phosphate mutarotase [Luminiphilus sp. nBUS_07]|uniref:D-hexose-6-phosphate mutarotase n=1 Tax=Luminiphilus sp. nBUS_07 TaxID=3395314 RepID=UPI003EBAB6B5